MANRETFKGRLGAYELLVSLGTSGAVEVQLGRRLDVHGWERFVRVEKLSADGAGDTQEETRFMRRARAGTLFTHPALDKTLELGKRKDGTFHIRGWLLGDGLGFLVARAREQGHAIEPALAAALVAQAAEGLHFVHTLRGSGQEQLGLIHQNVHPDNLVLTPKGQVKLINFSLTRKVNPPDPDRRVAYLSPEQCMIQEVDPRADVFSLGIVLWELLSGRRLFERQSEDATRKAVIACLVSSVGQIAKSVPADLAAICDRALARKPDDRFASAGEMAEALRSREDACPAAQESERIEAFVQAVSGERIQAKQEALERIEASPEAPVDRDLLLPGTTSTRVKPPVDPPADREPADKPVSTLPPRPVPQEEASETVEVVEMAAPEPAPPPAAQEPSGDEQDVEALDPLFDEDAAEITGQPPRQATSKERPDDFPEDEPVTVPRGKTRPPGAIGTPAGPPSDTAAPDASPADDDVPPRPGSDTLARLKSFYDQNRLACLVGGGVLLVLLLIVFWPSDEGESLEPTPAASGDSSEPGETPRPPEEVLAELEREQAEAAARRSTKPVLANIRVVSDPAGCRVWLDQHELAGKTPLAHLFVPAGLEYEVTVACKGHQKQSRHVTPGAERPAVLEFYPPPAGSPDRHFGRLQLTTRPRVWVYLGKKKLGLTPLLGARLPAGKHELRLINKPRRIRRTLEITIQPDQTTTLQKTF